MDEVDEMLDLSDEMLDYIASLDLSNVLYVDMDEIKDFTDDEWIRQNKDKLWFMDDDD